MSKQKHKFSFLIGLGICFILFPIRSYGAEGGGTITLTGGDPEFGVLDPEDHTKTVDPGEIPHTTGPLRIDFAPTLTFGETKIVDKTMTSTVDAQLFHQKTSPRANFIQVSDYRGTNTGWSLLVRQENQFRDEAKGNANLKGATLSFDKAWTFSSIDATLSPTVSKETITMNNVGETYPLAVAETGKGMGTWSISFGASQTNPRQQGNTLSPRVDRTGKAAMDTSFDNQPRMQNDAIQLNIPASEAIRAGNYSTVITWIIAELP